ncbi:uncharacterized protein METZ01_LOCUS72963, partial [marine metagenome]
MDQNSSRVGPGFLVGRNRPGWGGWLFWTLVGTCVVALRWGS